MHRQVFNSSGSYLTEKVRQECGAGPAHSAGSLWSQEPPAPSAARPARTSQPSQLRHGHQPDVLAVQHVRVRPGLCEGRARSAARPPRPAPRPPGRPSLTEVAQQSDLPPVPGQRQRVVLHPRAAAQIPQHGHAHPARAARPPPPPQQHNQQSRHSGRHRLPRPQTRPRGRHLGAPARQERRRGCAPWRRGGAAL